MSYTALVTGACGMIGSHLVDELVSRGTKVIALDPQPPWWIKKHVIEGKVVYIHGSSFDVAQMNKIRRKWGGELDEIYGIGAILGSEECTPRMDTAVNFTTLGARNEAELALDSGAKMFYILTEFVPSEGYVGFYDGYSVSKNAAADTVREYVRQYGLKAVFARVHHVFSPRQQLLPARKYLPAVIAYLAIGRKVPIFGTPEKRLDYVYAPDAARIIVELMRGGASEGVLYDIGGHEDNFLSLAEVARLVNREMLTRGRGVSGEPFVVVEDVRKQPPKSTRATNNWKEIINVAQVRFEDVIGKVVDGFLERFTDDDFRLAVSIFEGRKNYGV